MTEKLMSQKTGARNGRRLNWSDRIRNFVGRSLKAALPGVAIALASQVQTQADLAFKLEQVGSDVVMSVSGNINTGTLVGQAGWNQSVYLPHGFDVATSDGDSSFRYFQLLGTAGFDSFSNPQGGGSPARQGQSIFLSFTRRQVARLLARPHLLMTAESSIFTWKPDMFPGARLL